MPSSHRGSLGGSDLNERNGPCADGTARNQPGASAHSTSNPPEEVAERGGSEYERESIGGVCAREQQGEMTDEEGFNEAGHDPDNTPPQVRERIAMLEALVKQLQLKLEQAQANSPSPLEDLSVEEIEEKLKEACQKLMDGDESAQAEFDKWDQRLNDHPDKIAADARKEAEWEAEQGPLNEAALWLCRSFVPKDIRELNETQMLDLGIPKSIASRVRTKKCLWLTRMAPEAISKIHIADLKTKFASHKLDLLELRAVYACLPTAYENDNGNEKRDWGNGIRDKLKAAASRQPHELPPEELRDKAYLETIKDPIGPCSVPETDGPEPPDLKTIVALYSIAEAGYQRRAQAQAKKKKSLRPPLPQGGRNPAFANQLARALGGGGGAAAAAAAAARAPSKAPPPFTNPLSAILAKKASLQGSPLSSTTPKEVSSPAHSSLNPNVSNVADLLSERGRQEERGHTETIEQRKLPRVQEHSKTKATEVPSSQRQLSGAPKHSSRDGEDTERKSPILPNDAESFQQKHQPNSTSNSRVEAKAIGKVASMMKQFEELSKPTENSQTPSLSSVRALEFQRAAGEGKLLDETSTQEFRKTLDGVLRGPRSETRKQEGQDQLSELAPGMPSSNSSQMPPIEMMTSFVHIEPDNLPNTTSKIQHMLASCIEEIVTLRRSAGRRNTPKREIFLEFEGASDSEEWESAVASNDGGTPGSTRRDTWVSPELVQEFSTATENIKDFGRYALQDLKWRHGVALEYAPSQFDLAEEDDIVLVDMMPDC